MKGFISVIYFKNPVNDAAALIPFRLKFDRNNFNELTDVSFIKEKTRLYPKIAEFEQLLNTFSVYREEFADQRNSIGVVTTRDIHLYNPNAEKAFVYHGLEVEDCMNVH